MNFPKKNLKKTGIGLGIAFALAVFFHLASGTRTYQMMELKALDLRFVLQGNSRGIAPVVHIDIDDQSLEKLGRWPWPREYHAKMLSMLQECGARQVLFDVLFMEPYQEDPGQDERFAGALAQTGIGYLPFYFLEGETNRTISPRLREAVRASIDLDVAAAAKLEGCSEEQIKEILPLAKRQVIDEAALALVRRNEKLSLDELLDALEQAKGWSFFTEDETYVAERLAYYRALSLFLRRFSLPLPAQEWPFKKTYQGLSVPIQIFLESMKGSGYISTDADVDGVTRKVPLLIKYGDRVLPQLTIAALREYLQVDSIDAKPGWVVLKNALREDRRRDIAIPVDEDGYMIVNWRGRWGRSFRHIPFHYILRLYDLRQEVAAEAGASRANDANIAYARKSEEDMRNNLTRIVKGAICIVGLTATGTHDLRPIPLQANYPMVGTHSNAIDTILSGRFIVRKEGPVSVLVFFLCALAIGLTASLAKLGRSLLLTSCYTAGFFALAFVLFSRFGIWIDLVGPLGILLFGFTGITSYRFFSEEKEKLWIKHAFSHYLSQEVINELLNDPDKLKLGGERRQITVLFSDIRGFTSFSESRQPEEVVAMLNEVLTEQVKVVFKYNGTLDKFVGDELMAFFGAPSKVHEKDHALVAVRVAVEIQQRMNELRAKWQQENKPILHIGIGVNTGDMVVGNMGSAARMDYTVIGDNVNLGARLCSAAGKDEVIVSGYTYEGISGQVEAERLEPIMVKGKAKPIEVYRITAMK